MKMNSTLRPLVQKTVLELEKENFEYQQDKVGILLDKKTSNSELIKIEGTQERVVQNIMLAKRKLLNRRENKVVDYSNVDPRLFELYCKEMENK